MPAEEAGHKTRPHNDLITFTRDEIDLIRRTKLPDGSGEDDLNLLLYYARKTGLNPLLNQVYLSRRNGKSQPQATIDGFRIAAERTGKYLGQTTPMFCGPDGVWTDAWVSNQPPVLARVGVLRHGFREALFGVARYDAYLQRNREGKIMDTWARMPDTMLAKTAEALAYRKAFPDILSGLYTDLEMDHLDNENPEEGPVTPPAQPTSSKPTPVGKPAAPTPKPSAPTGAQASAPQSGAPAQAPAPQPSTQTPVPGGVTEEQVKGMWSLAQGLGLDVSGLTRTINEILGKSYGSPREVTSDEANKVIVELERRRDDAPPQQAAS